MELWSDVFSLLPYGYTLPYVQSKGVFTLRPEAVRRFYMLDVLSFMYTFS